MITAILILFYRCTVTLVEFALNVFMAIIQFFFYLITTAVKTAIERIKEKKEKESTSEDETEEESENVESGKFVILVCTESGWTPMAYFDTYMDAYRQMKYERSLPGAHDMIIQEVG